jgi:hypothetical protein
MLQVRESRGELERFLEQDVSRLEGVLLQIKKPSPIK